MCTMPSARLSARGPVAAVPNPSELAAHERTLERELERFDG